MDRSFHVLSFDIYCLLCGFTGDVEESRKVDIHFVAKISDHRSINGLKFFPVVL